MKRLAAPPLWPSKPKEKRSRNEFARREPVIASHPAETAPKDGRVIRGWFRFDGGAQLIAVSWDGERSAWVNLLGEPVLKGVLKKWGDC